MGEHTSNRGLRRVTVAALGGALLASVLPSAMPAAQASPIPDDRTPNTPKLAGKLANQKIAWHKCDFGSEALNKRFAEKDNVQCAEVTVPRDWHKPGDGNTMKIAISQVKNVGVADKKAYKGTIFANPGGPGGEGLIWGPAMSEFTPQLQGSYNYVGFDPRGVGKSTHVPCSFEYDQNSTDKYAELKAFAKTCSKDPAVKTITTEQTAYDMDFIRYLVDAPKLSYVGYSYGTWLGTMYGNLFGKNADKLVLDSTTAAVQPTLQSTWDVQPLGRDRQFKEHMMNWIARHADKYKLGTDPAAIYKRYLKASKAMGEDLVAMLWSFSGATAALPDNTKYPAAAALVQLVVQVGEGKKTAASAEQNPAEKADALLNSLKSKSLDAEQQKLVATTRQNIEPLLGMKKLAQPTQQKAAAPKIKKQTQDEIFYYILCQDGQWNQDLKYWEDRVAKDSKKYPLSNSWGLISVSPCAFWKTSNSMPTADYNTFPKTIVVQGEMDSQTAWEGGSQTGKKLPNTSFIAVDNEGSHGLFPYGTTDVDQPILNFFKTGKLPKNITVAQAKPLTQDVATFESGRRLNDKAEFVGKDENYAWQQVKRQPKLPPTKAAQLLAETGADTIMKQVARQYYGIDGEQKVAAHQR